VPEDLVFVCEGAQPLIDVWIVHRRPRRAAEKAETEACHFWTTRCRLGTLRVGVGAVGEEEECAGIPKCIIGDGGCK
jgi:hypothetical protein